MNTCAFTGHRPSHFHFQYDEQHPDCLALKDCMRTEIMKLVERGIMTFLSGMALGVDTWGAEIILELKPQHPRLKLIAVIPCETQANKWSDKQRERYFTLLAQCDEEIYVSRRYTRSCMFDRNRYLVNHSDILLAIYDGDSKGGTAYTVRYAQEKKREVIIIPAFACYPCIDINEFLVRE